MVSKSTTHSHNESAFSQDLHCMKSYLPSENHIVSNSENSKEKGNTFYKPQEEEKRATYFHTNIWFL